MEQFKTLGPYTPDPTETTYTSYTPTPSRQLLSCYSIILDTVYIWNDTSDSEQTWTNDIFLGSVSDPYNFTVASEPSTLHCQTAIHFQHNTGTTQ